MNYTGVVAALVVAGCSSTGVTHNSRQLTCLGFCAETTIKHTVPGEKPDEEKPEQKPEVSK